MADKELIKLYKYKPIDKWSLDIIKTKKIWVPKPESFNDPFDCDINISKELKKEEKTEFLNSYLHDAEKIGYESNYLRTMCFDINGQINVNGEKIIDNFNVEKSIEKSKNVGVLSLTETPTNILMWSHYAKGHKGICLEFSIHSLSKPLDIRIHKVNYMDQLPIYSLLDTIKFNFVEVFLTTKNIKWAYEKERRKIYPKGNIFAELPGEITGIIFGLKTSPEDIERVKKAASAIPNIKFYECRKASGRFAVDIVEIPR